MKVSNELKVALTILAAIFLGFIGYRVMSDLPLFRQSNVIHAYFNRADGLTPGNYIHINGVKVGSVKKIELLKGDSVKVTMGFDLGIEIPKNSVAYLESSGLLDEKSVVVKRGDAPKNLHYGDYMEGVYRGGMFETLQQEGKQLSGNVSTSFEKLNKFLAQLNSTLNDQNKEQINSVLENLESTSNNISDLMEQKRSDIESSITHAKNFLATVDTVSAQNKDRIDSVMVGLDKSLNELEKLSRDLNKTNHQLDEILTKINNGEGSLGKLVNDSTLYNNLESLTSEMNSLVKNINEDPRKYLKHMKLIELF